MTDKIKLKDILALSRQTGGLFYATVFALILAAVMTLVIPVGFRFLIDHHQQASQIAFFMLLLGAILLAFATSMRFYCVSLLGEKISQTLQQKFFDKMMLFSAHEFDIYNLSDLMNRFTLDTGQVRQFAGTSLSVAARNILLLLGGFSMMLWTSPILSLIALMIIPIILVPVGVMRKKLKQASMLAEQGQNQKMMRAEEVFSALDMVQSFNQEENEKHHFQNILTHAYDLQKKRIFYRGILTFSIVALVFMGVIAVLYYGITLVQTQQMPAGLLAQFIFYAIFTAGAVSSLSDVGHEWQKTVMAYGRLHAIDTLVPMITQCLNHVPCNKAMQGKISFQNITHQYESRTHKTLDDFCLNIQSGQKLGIIGKSGSGKTTLFRLLLRQRHLQAGQILIDQRPIDVYALSDLRKNIAYVSQDSVLLTGTIFDNIAFGNSQATQEQIESAAKSAYLHDFIMTLPDGYHTLIGYKGVSLSGGQKQRLTIARAMVKNAPILLLDEATSSLDKESETLIAQALDNLYAGKTVLSITHRLSSLSKMDKIIMLDEGKNIREATYQEMLSLHSELFDTEALLT